MSGKTTHAIRTHEASGRYFDAGGVRSFALDRGDGDPVVLLHGVPTSSFLYRRLVPLLSGSFRAVAFDFPGLGLAGRPQDFDYSWSGLARWFESALESLGIGRFHLVVHDIGGPIGCDVAVRQPERILTLTALNTLLDVAGFRRPWPMKPFPVALLGEAYLGMTPRIVFSELMYLVGIEDRSATPRSDVYAHYELLRRGDRGRAFLRIMRGFELTRQKQEFLWEGLAMRPYPAQVVWGAHDRALGEGRRLAVQRALGVDEPLLVPAKHFPQEDQATALASAIAAFASRAPLRLASAPKPGHCGAHHPGRVLDPP
jgi:haloalkane dehalogenase